eukprot:UN23333
MGDSIVNCTRYLIPYICCQGKVCYENMYRIFTEIILVLYPDLDIDDYFLMSQNRRIQV